MRNFTGHTSIPFSSSWNNPYSNDGYRLYEWGISSSSATFPGSSGSLPPGITITQQGSLAVISGTPTTPGTYNATVVFGSTNPLTRESPKFYGFISSEQITFTVSSSGAYSIDGIIWTSFALPVSQNWTSVAYGGNKFVAISADSSATAYSSNGITWTQGAMPINENWNAITFGGDKFVAISKSGDSERKYIAYSYNGINWSFGTLAPNYAWASLNWNSIAYGNGKFVAISQESGLLYSNNGIDWTTSQLPNVGQYKSIAYGNGKFVAIIQDLNTAFQSIDGITWTQFTLPNNRIWNSIAYGNNKFVAVANGGISPFVI